MNRSRVFLALLCLTLWGAAARAAEPGPFVGANLGWAVPTNENLSAHANNGGTGDPYVGYMFNKYVGAQGELHFTFFPPDNDHRGFPNENTFSTLFGGTVGPRLSIPIGDLVDIYATGQGGYYTGLSGRFTHSAPGFTVGGGIDYNITRELAVGVFGRWNRVYMSPHPTFLVYQEPSAQGPSDARFATAGISLKYTFAQPKPAPPPPPPPPVAQKPAPPVKKKIVLRSVHFDFNKATIRQDAIPVLNEAVNVLKEEGTVGVICAGHTDSVGSDAYNMKLSRRRADAVRDYLVKHGIPANRIRVEGFGERKPVASNATADGRAQNRRVELNLD
ncbi:MAG TPA: OmpA family protein [Candidatus Margulisiibacteriota bacterium]|nr:OmpA family protein [Candidatus Margulisiibacteriota bacterium]